LFAQEDSRYAPSQSFHLLLATLYGRQKTVGLRLKLLGLITAARLALKPVAVGQLAMAYAAEKYCGHSCSVLLLVVDPPRYTAIYLPDTPKNHHTSLKFIAQ
jgi:hypothetical protein